MTSPTTTSTTARPKLPAGLRWSNVWRTPQGGFVEGDRELPVTTEWEIAGRLFLCRVKDCNVEEWSFVAKDADGQPQPCCPKHPERLIEEVLDTNASNPVGSAKARLRERVKAVVAARRDKAVAAAQEAAAAARAAAAEAARRRAADLKGHVPSLAATGGWLLAGLVAAGTQPRLAVAAVGLLVATVGTVVGYLAAYWLAARRARNAGKNLAGRAGRRVRGHARHIGAGTLAAGVWLILAAAVGVGPVRVPVLLVFGFLAAYVVNRKHWDELWATRRRLAELARLRAQQAEKKVEEAEKAADEPAPAAEEETPEVVGRRFAAEWDRIARSDTVPPGFLMSRTRIVVEETREATAPIDGQVVRIGWEFAIEAEPGTLVPRIGGAAPLLQAREWLAAMLGKDPSLVALVDRPDGRPNRGLIIVTDEMQLGGSIQWKGRDGIRVASDGSLYAHVGRTMKGDDIEELLFTPGQAHGGLTVGGIGGGKTYGAILRFLNMLAAGIFPVLHDPKQLVDLADFLGVFPIGVTPEHRDLIMHNLHCERVRREQHLASLKGKDRHGRVRAMAPVWNTRRDGPPVRSVFEEFHVNAKDQAFIASLATLIRLQRGAGMGTDLISQGGGLADFADSALRGLSAEVGLRLYRVSDHLARLAGYKGTIAPSDLPRLPGMCLAVDGEAPEMPIRTAYVTREDEDGCVFDQLYAPDMTPILTAPDLPKATEEVWRREGLLDLWDLGKGPDGMSKLLADNNALQPPVGAVASVPGGVMQAADVLLAIVVTRPGCGRQVIDSHEAWLSAAGGGKPPVPSTLGRAAKSLEEQGLLTRTKQGVEYVDYRVTDKGQARAMVALSVLMPSVAQAKPPAVEVTAADVEHQAEMAAEQLMLTEAGQ